MAPLGTLNATYKLSLRGLGLTERVTTSSALREVVVAPIDNGEQVHAEIKLKDVTEADGTLEAEEIATCLYQALLQGLSDHIHIATPPESLVTSFTPTGGPTAHRGLARGGSIVIGHGRALLNSHIVKPVLDMVWSQLTAPGLAAKPYVAAARHLFRAAMEVADPVASYLTCYSALTLVAANEAGDSKQSSVDKVIVKLEPSVKQVSRTRNGKAITETLYTWIRNRFVHADEVGGDPAAAARDMTTELRAIRRLCAQAIA